MEFSELYRKQVALLVRILPHVAREDCFALKGGTAINLFIRNLPRLSVDIDLTYLPVNGAQHLPAVKWREFNLERAGEGTCEELLRKLEKVISI